MRSLAEDSAALVELRTLVRKGPGWNPVMSEFCLSEFAHKRRQYWFSTHEEDVEDEYDDSLFYNLCKINKLKLN